MKLSLCMISKDEEKLIGSALASIKKYVDEIILVDTGSIDQTTAIALKYGARVYHQKWEDNFAKARNFALDRAKGEWILCLDADETLENGELLAEIISKAEEDVQGIITQIFNYNSLNLPPSEKSFSIRLFRNKKFLRYSGAIHEQLNINKGKVIFSELIINHYGYIPAISQSKNKPARNLNILLKEIAENPNDSFTLYNIGCEYLRLNDYQKALNYYNQSLTNADSTSNYTSRLYKMNAICCLHLKNYSAAADVCQKGLKIYPDFPDLHYYLGLTYKELGKNLLAIISLLKCLSLEENEKSNSNLYTIEEGVTNYRTLFVLGQIYQKQQNIAEAKAAFARALSSNPRLVDALISLRGLFENNQEFSDYLKNSFTTTQQIAIAQQLSALKNFSQALKLLKELKDAALESAQPQINLLMGINHFLLFDFNSAITGLSSISQEDPHYEKSLPYLIASYWIIGDPVHAKKIFSSSKISAKDLYQKITDLFLTLSENKLQEGITKFPNSQKIKDELARIKKVRNNESS